MKKLIVSSLFTFSLTLTPALALAGGKGGECSHSKQALSETAESVIAQHLKALGGEDKLRAARTLHLTATRYEGDQRSTVTLQRSRPNQMRYEAQKGGTTFIKAFDGTNGWYVEGNAPARVVEKEKLSKMAQKADFDDMLVDYAKKGVKVELAGVKEINGAPAYKLVLTRGDEVEARFLDKQSFLEVKRVSTYTHEGKKVKKAIKFSDYRSVDGIMVSFLTEWEHDGVKGKSVVESARFGAPIDASVYRMPAPRS